MKPIQPTTANPIAPTIRACLGVVAGLLVASCAWAQSNYATPFAISTFAGVPIGSSDGTGSAARLYNPYAVAVDSSGNVFVADTGNNIIRKVTPAGVVTTLAGTAGLYGNADGTGSAARFDIVEGIAVDGSDNVFVADTLNSTIRKITPGGVVTTFAGTPGVIGSADGTGSAALFNNPSGVATDGAGNVYVADSNNFTIRKITPAGVGRSPGRRGVSGTRTARAPRRHSIPRQASRWTAPAISTSRIPRT